MPGTKPLKVHAKALLACVRLIGFALGFSWAVPFLFVKCTRSGDRVNCVVEQRMLALIPFDSTAIHGLDRAEVVVEDGSGSGSRRTTETSFLVLVDREGVAKRFMLDSLRNPSATQGTGLADGVNDFVASGGEQFADWAAPLLGYGPFVPAALGAVFLILVSWDMVSTRDRSGDGAKANEEKPGDARR
jgi:hypothetical protein